MTNACVVASAVVDAEGTIMTHEQIPTRADEGRDATVARIVALVRSLASSHPMVAAIGVGVPGVVDPRTHIVQCPPNLPGWDAVPLQRIIADVTGLPVAVDNDANAAALAEAAIGAGRDTPHFLYVTLGTGIGGGVIIDGHVYSGPYGDAGEIGHIIVDHHAVPTQAMLAHGLRFRAGTMEELVGRPGLLRTWRELREHHASDVSDDADVIDMQHGAANGDALAIACLTQAGAILGVGLASALAVLGMHVVVIGGGISKATTLVDAAIDTMRQRAIPTIARNLDVRRARFEADAGIVGAAMLAQRIA